MPPTPAPLRADLVLEGGGVKGIALVGAVTALAEAGYSFPRVAGSSAGAIVASVVAALQHAGEPLSRAEEILWSLDFRRFRDEGPLGLLGPVGDALSVVLTNGGYEGRYLHGWLRGVLGELGVETFGDLRLTDDPGGDLPDELRYALMVTASDVSRRTLIRLPWEYGDYDLDRDEQPVADAVRASAAIPFFFRPVELKPGGGGTASTLVDGGVL